MRPDYEGFRDTLTQKRRKGRRLEQRPAIVVKPRARKECEVGSSVGAVDAERVQRRYTNNDEDGSDDDVLAIARRWGRKGTEGRAY
jgi:hypothetical protein